MDDVLWPRSLVILIVIVVVAAGGLAGFVYYETRPKSPGAAVVIVEGDNATVNYIGIFGSGSQVGKIFDTSLYAVGSDNAAYPKSLDYHARGVPANYTPLGVYVGPSAPSGGYMIGSTTFVSVVTGFWQGLIGLPTNVTSFITVPPALGYGPSNPACVRSVSLAYSVPVFLTYSFASFQKAYPGITPLTSLVFTDPHYGWNDLVYSVNATTVTVQNLPAVGWIAMPQGWPVEVTAITTASNGTSEIQLLNKLTPDQAGLLAGTDYLGTGPCSSQVSGRFIVTAVDLNAGTYTEDFNPEVQGQTLIFAVTVVTIYPSGFTLA